MALTPSGIAVDPRGQTATVTITEPSGATATVYIDKDGSSVRSMPAAINSRTVFYLLSEMNYTLSVKVNGVERANGAGGTLTVDLSAGGVFSVNIPVLDTDEQANLAGAYEPIGGALTRLRAVGFGDSTVAGALKDALGNTVGTGGGYSFTAPLIGSERAGPQSWFTWACLASGGRLLNVHNAGVANDTTAGCLARFATDVVAFKPDVVFISGGVHNDISSSIATATTRANVVAMIDAARAAGILPILVTIYPENNASFTAAIRKHNVWLKNLAAGRDATYGRIGKLIVVDPYAAVIDTTSTTGAWVAANTVDGTHATAIGAQLAATKVLADLGGLLRGNANGGAFVATDNVQGSPNGFTNPLFTTDSNADGKADSWHVLATAGTATLVTDSAVLGKAQQLVITSAGADISKTLTLSTLGWNVGDKIKFSGMVKVTAGASLNWYVQMTSAQVPGWIVQPIPPNQLDVGWCYFECEGVIPVGATGLDLGIYGGSGLGTMSAAQFSVINLTSGL